MICIDSVKVGNGSYFGNLIVCYLLNGDKISAKEINTRSSINI